MVKKVDPINNPDTQSHLPPKQLADKRLEGQIFENGTRVKNLGLEHVQMSKIEDLQRASFVVKRSSLAENYKQARSEFLDAAINLNCEISSFELPNFPELFIDFARLGPAKAEKVYLNISGVHGVEGFIGSAIQRELLLNAPVLPNNTAIYLCHALNPYGMEYLRRVNENNVDLNRNYHLNQTGFCRTNEDYGNLFSFLNPKSLFPMLDLCYLSSAFQILKAGGIGPIKRALTLGQYDFPEGLYYGGKTRQASLDILQAYLEEEWSSAKQIIAVETHTGLGDFAKSTLLVSKESSSELVQSLQDSAVDFEIEIEKQGGNRVGVETAGAIGDAVSQVYKNSEILWVTQEIGTYNTLKVFKALRAENCLHRQGQTNPKHWSKRQLKVVFTPNSQEWVRKSLNDGLLFVENCLAILRQDDFKN